MKRCSHTGVDAVDRNIMVRAPSAASPNRPMALVNAYVSETKMFVIRTVTRSRGKK
jgi:hypothetical protein